MLARIRSWWAGRSRAERLIFAIGVPVAAVAALWGNLRDRRVAGQEEALEGEGGPGTEATFTDQAGAPAAGGGVINAGAPGIGFDQIAQFTEVFTGELGAIEQSLEEQFGQSAAERAAADAALEARLEELEEQIEEAAERPPASPKPGKPKPAPLPMPTPAPKPKPAPEKPSTRTVTYTVKRGDTLWKIARAHGLSSWQPIYNANRSVIGSNPDLIKPGQRLKITVPG